MVHERLLIEDFEQSFGPLQADPIAFLFGQVYDSLKMTIEVSIIVRLILVPPISWRKSTI